MNQHGPVQTSMTQKEPLCQPFLPPWCRKPPPCALLVLLPRARPAQTSINQYKPVPDGVGVEALHGPHVLVEVDVGGEGDVGVVGRVVVGDGAGGQPQAPQHCAHQYRPVRTSMDQYEPVQTSMNQYRPVCSQEP